MKNKKFILLLLITTVFTGSVLFGVNVFDTIFNHSIAAQTISLKSVSQQISATGSIHSEQEVTLHFQTGGKIVYLPFKQGDTVTQGQTIAQLDTYALQRTLTTALNNYRLTREGFDQTQQNASTNVAQTQQQPGFAGIQADKTNAINDAVKRILDESQGTLDNSVINVELANYAVQLASLTAPFTGTVIEEDITTPNVNVTPLTSFTIADPNQKVFRGEVVSSDIDFVSVGSRATIKLDGQSKILTGSVITVYPQKKTLATGQQVYDVDIEVDNLATNTLFGQNGSVLISSNNQTQALMVPTWTIVGHNSVWVWNGTRSVLQKIQTGKVYGDMTEVLSGLSKQDKVITLPFDIAKQKYQIL